MKKNYRLLFLFFGLLLSSMSYGQLVSLGTVSICSQSGGAVSNLLDMVTLNGVTPTSSQVTISYVSSDNPQLTLSGTSVFVASGIQTGHWTLNYQVCETANPTNCITASAIYDALSPNSTVIQPTCSFSQGTIIFNDMPTGNWLLSESQGGIFIEGNTTTYTINSLSPGFYFFTIIGGLGSCETEIGISVEPQPWIPNFSIAPQTCNDPINSISIIDLPTDVWTLSYTLISSGVTTTVTGSGSTYTISGLTSPGDYYVTVTNNAGCTSTQYVPSIGYLNSGLSGNMTATYVDYNNDGVTNLGDIIQYDVSITNNLACTMESVTYSIQNSNNTLGTFTNLAAGATANGTLNYPLTQNDINNGSVFNWIAVNGLSNGYETYIKLFDQNQNITLTLSDGIKLNAFFDTNNDGIQNNGEQNSSLGNFTYQLNNNGSDHYLYSENGTNIIYESNHTNTYALSFNLYNSCTDEYNVSATNYSNVTVPAGSGITTYNFPISQSPCQDVQINLSGSAPRPGFNYTNYITYRNTGNQTLTSGTITFTKDNALTITSISEATAVTTATGFTYNFTNLLPNEARSINVTMLVPTIPTVTLGQLLTNSASITIPSNDINQSNNSSTLTQPIVGSFDPNDKTESHGGKILHTGFTADDYLTYMIRFENTGTASAINIRVNDILDEQLNETTIRMVRASHPYVLDRIGKNLTWRFDGVNLPPSVSGDEVTGHGYIVFQIKPNSGFAIGDIIPNVAEIFFDFNPAIVTNTCTTEFVPLLGVNTFESDTFEYYPNPTSDTITFHLKNTSTTIETITVMDILGKTLLTKTNNHSNAFIDLSSLSKGMYLVKVKAAGQEKTVKINKN
jgi:uncharacterized repeat protein (TIGR01451 family)